MGLDSARHSRIASLVGTMALAEPVHSFHHKRDRVEEEKRQICYIHTIKQYTVNKMKNEQVINKMNLLQNQS